MPDNIRPKSPKPNEQGNGVPAGLWQKCPKCRTMLYAKELERDLRVCHHCQHHFPLTTMERLKLLADEASFVEIDNDMIPANPLNFPGYDEKLAKGQLKSGLKEAMIYGDATITDIPVVLGLMNFEVMGGSMGSVVGEKTALALERGIASGQPVIFSCSSGGARMQEGMVSLMQMAKTAAACARFKASGGLYITILNNPTTGGVWASFASLGDVIIAEPDALIALTGPRVIEQNLKIKLPPGTSTAEFQLAHGMVDMVVHRRELRSTIAKLLQMLAPASAAEDKK